MPGNVQRWWGKPVNNGVQAEIVDLLRTQDHLTKHDIAFAINGKYPTVAASISLLTLEGWLIRRGDRYSLASPPPVEDKNRANRYESRNLKKKTITRTPHQFSVGENYAFRCISHDVDGYPVFQKVDDGKLFRAIEI